MMTYLSRRQVLQTLTAIACTAPGIKPLAAGVNDDRMLLATQILNGTTPTTRSMIDNLFEALAQELGQDTVSRLITAVLQRDADSITQAFDDEQIEQAAQRALEMFYSGEIKNADGQADALYYHQALAWQVLDFAKPPSICGSGFGWWAAKPDSVV